MQRRQFLETCGAVTAGTVAGCNSDEPEATETASTPTTAEGRSGTVAVEESRGGGEPREDGFTPWIGKNGGLHLFAQPGELTVEIAGLSLADDVNRLETVLASPDRDVLDKATVDTIEQPSGERTETATLTANVERAGLYIVSIYAPENQWGDDVAWSFRTSCDRYLAEAAGHHSSEEPIVLRDQSSSGTVWFEPPTESFDVDVTNLAESLTELTIVDSDGSAVTTLPVEDGEVSTTVSSGASTNEGPWGLQLPIAQASIEMDGVTRGEGHPDWSDDPPNLVVWTDDVSSWMDLEPHRWLGRPYGRLLYGTPGERGTHTITVLNNDTREHEYDLTLESSGGSWSGSLSETSLTLEPGATREVTLEYTFPGEHDAEQTAYVRIDPTDAETDVHSYVSLTVSTEREDSKPFTTPMQVKPWEHENEQFGYVIDYPEDGWEVYADRNDRWSMNVAGKGIATYADGSWNRTNFASAVNSGSDHFQGATYDDESREAGIYFDEDNDMYHLGRTGSRVALLHSSDGGETFSAYDLGPADVSYEIECYNGHNQSPRPPVVLRAKEVEREGWRRVSELELVPVEKQDGQLTLGDPVSLTETSLGIGSHTGKAAPVVSTNSIAHIVWAEATAPDGDAPGTPAYAVSYDREQGELLSEPTLIGHSADPNDTHNLPTITMDSEGYLHTVLGASHSKQFEYSRSEAPHTAHGGWTDTEKTTSVIQAYPGLVCDSEDTLHLVFSSYRNDVEPHPNTHQSTVRYQRKPKGGSWEPPQLMLVPPFAGYSGSYHRLTIGRDDRLMLSYDCWTTYRFYRFEDRDTDGYQRKIMTSTDSGETWQLLDSDDLAE